MTRTGDHDQSDSHGGQAGSAALLVASLVGIYIISQFFRSSTGVIGPDLAREFSLDAAQLSLLSSLFFLSFAAAQIPLGIAIDRFGPKAAMLATAVILIASTLMFALADNFFVLAAARLLLGVGCCSYLMAPLAIYAERFTPQRFATMVGVQLGGGSLGMLAAIYLSSYASPALRALAKPMLEVLAGIPTVVWGFVAALTVAPWVRRLGEALGFATSAQSALAAGLVLGLMILPFVSSLVDDALGAVPPALRDGSLALGATRAETIARILVPAAMPGIMAAFLLAVSRAVGETMIVVMAAGLAANLTANPLASVTTITVQIVTLLAGDQEFDSAKTLAAFALGLVLFTTTLLLNLLALRAIRAGRTRHG